MHKVSIVVTSGKFRISMIDLVLVEVTHETARVISTNDVDENQCRLFATELLQKNGLSDATIVFDPSPSSSLRRGSRVSVSISVPISGNVTTFSRFFGNVTLAADSTVNREVGEFPLNMDSND